VITEGTIKVQPGSTVIVKTDADAK